MPYVRPIRRRYLLGLGSAIGASILVLLVPQVLQWLVDGPLSSGDRSQVFTAGALVLGLGVIEAALWWGRRAFVFSPVVNVEFRMRRDLYDRLQHLPVGFHDQWESGQLLSRSSTDLSIVRQWLAFSSIFLVVNSLMVVVGIVLMTAMSPLLGLVFAVIMAPIIPITATFERRYERASRRSQDQVGTLATQIGRAHV